MNKIESPMTKQNMIQLIKDIDKHIRYGRSHNHTDGKYIHECYYCYYLLPRIKEIIGE